MLSRNPPKEKQNACALYVGVAVYGTPQDCNWASLCFGVAVGFGVCFGVWYASFSSQEQHGSMLKSPRCGCGGMLKVTSKNSEQPAWNMPNYKSTENRQNQWVPKVTKRSLSYLLIALIGLSLIAAALPTDKAQTGTTVGGVISQDETWTAANSPYTFTGNLLIDEGSTLKIEPGVTVNIGTYFMRVSGILDARGSADDRIIINVPAADPSSKATSAIEFQNSDSILQFTLLNSERTYYPTITTTNNASVKIDNNIIRAPSDGYAIWSESNSIPTISNNDISGTVFIQCIRGGTVSGNTIVNPNAPALVVGGNVSVSCNTVYGSNSGITCRELFSPGSSDYAVNLEQNLIINNTIGLTVDSGSHIIVQHNTITGNVAGIVMYSQEPNNVLNYPITENNIYDNSIYNVHTYTSLDTDLPSNWWGTTDTSVISQKNYAESDFNTGAVLTSSVLSEPDAQAPMCVYASTDQNGDVEPSGYIRVYQHGSLTFDVAAKTGYNLADIQVNGTSVNLSDHLTIEDVTGGTTLYITFAPGQSTTPSNTPNTNNETDTTPSISSPSSVAGDSISNQNDQSQLPEYIGILYGVGISVIIIVVVIGALFLMTRPKKAKRYSSKLSP